MGNVATVRCRSYSAQEFDGCSSCLDAALEAVTQAGLYLVGRSAPSLASPDTSGPINMSYRLKMRLFDEFDRQIADDEVDARQTISEVPVDDDGTNRLAESYPGETAGWSETDDLADDDTASSMRLDDFQTVLDQMELAPVGSRGVTGAIIGRLYGFERNICRFEMEVC